MASIVVGCDLWTSDMVLAEVANACACFPLREKAADLIRQLLESAQIHVVHLSPELFHFAIEMYKKHSDKSWSLTDCLSFKIMADNQMTDALTADRHFEQASFRALMLADDLAEE